MKYSELEFAYDSVNSGSEIADNSAFVSRKTGEILFDWDESFSGEPGLPESIYEDEDYVQIPEKRDLDLGTSLVWDFVRQEIPGLEQKVREIFSRRGAYARYKDFLRYNDILEQWYDFENRRTKEALLEWCSENGIKIDENKALGENSEPLRDSESSS